MCTLTYIPHSTGFTLTHNRDERNDRPSSETFVEQKINGATVFYPQDLEGTGTWFAIGKAYSLCVLNGGSQDYTTKQNYRHSRGLVPLHFFEYDNPGDFFNRYNFEGLEPFTLVIATGKRLWKLVHDESFNQLLVLDASKKHIWSSTKLYAPDIRAKREAWFLKWLDKNPEPSYNSILEFHTHAGDGDTENDLRMSRWGILQTVSITQLSQHYNKQELYYKVFETGSEDKKRVQF